MVYSAKKNLPESHLVKIVGLWMKMVSADLSQEDLQAELEIEVDKFTSLGGEWPNLHYEMGLQIYLEVGPYIWKQAAWISQPQVSWAISLFCIMLLWFYFLTI